MFAGRKVVLTGGPLAAMTGMCRRLRDLGAERPFLLATGVGTGEVPGADEAEWCVVEIRAPDVIAEIRAAMRLLRLLPGEVVAALDRWDPERRALVLSPMFNELPEIAGRRVYGPRRAEWRRLEDKVVVDDLWDELGVTRAPSEVVAADPAALRAAARRLDRGAGTAWAGDARQGFNGGAFCLRWVREEEDAVEAAAFLAERCDRVRVMPFLEGIPCSIHGVVFPQGVATFRPVEMVTLRRPGSNRLRYAGAATFWDPPAARPGGHARPGAPGRGRVARTGRLPGRLHRRRGAGGRGVPAHRAEPAPRGRAVDDDQGPPRPAGRPARPGPHRGRAARLRRGRPGAPGAADRRPGPRRRRLDGHRGRDRRDQGAAGGVRGRRLPAGGRRPGGRRDGVVRAFGGRRVRAGGPRPRHASRRVRRWHRWRWPPSPWPTSGSAAGSVRWRRRGRSADRDDAPPGPGGASLDPVCRAAR